jgi:hypothetical protein
MRLGAEAGAHAVAHAAIARPMVATTMGISPNLSSGSAMPRLKAQPSTPTASTSREHEGHRQRRRPRPMKPSIAKAGSITNSPWAKLMVPDACHSRVKPSAASA